jgi:DNA mismatch endonuclease (patch repair protein)
MPTTRSDFWREKLEGNESRDRKNVEALLAFGWRVLVVWECATRKNATGLSDALVEWIQGNELYGEMAGTLSHLTK